MQSQDVDYRVIYSEEDLFKVRMTDAYIAHKTSNRPPNFLSMLREFLDLECILFYEAYKELFVELNEQQHEQLKRDLLDEKDHALVYVQERMERRYIEQFSHDFYLHLLTNQWFFFETLPSSNHLFTHYNSPIQDVW